MIGYLEQHDSLTKIVIEADVTGHINRGRPRMENIKQMMLGVGKSIKSWKNWVRIEIHEDLQQTNQMIEGVRNSTNICL